MRAVSKDKMNVWFTSETRDGNFKAIKREYFGVKRNIYTRTPYYGFKTVEKANEFIMRRIEESGEEFEIDRIA